MKEIVKSFVFVHMTLWFNNKKCDFACTKHAVNEF